MNELLHELFESSVDRGPQRPAVICGQSRLTYQQLDERANRIARWLLGRGVGAEDRVAILLPRSDFAYPAILGVLKAGAAYVPLDPDAPADRIAFILKDSGAKGLVTLAGPAEALAGHIPEGVFLLRLDADAQEIEKLSSSRVPRAQTETAPENLCYVIYTSGTTGQPKGVQIEHRSATNLVRAESRLYGVRPDDRIFQFFSLAFDASVEEIWLAFFHGAALVVGEREALRAGPEFSRTLSRLGVTVFSCVPTFLSMLEDDIPTLRLLILGGETCPEDIANRWCRTGRRVFNTYGPTEATVIATAAELTPNRPVTIGRPISNYQVFILNENLEPVPQGSEGELCIAGAGVARGYLNRPQLEEQKFVMTLKLTGNFLRLYRTGDMARLNAEGEFEYVGRSDDQVKIRGYRVELSEIETALMQCPGVLAAAASLQIQTQRIAAYIVPRGDAKPDRAVLREMLSSRLPVYMIPAYLDELESLPMTVSGKVDRRRLPAPKSPLNDGVREILAARDEAERGISTIWKSVLGREDISVLDDFFLDLGGHSLLAALAVSKIRNIPGFERISIGELYANPTVEKLSRLIRKSKAGDEAKSKSNPPFHSPPAWSYAACAAGQGLGVLFLAGLYAWEWLGAFLAYGYLVVEDWPVRRALAVALAVELAATPVLLALSIALKWLLLGKIKPGRYPLWGWFYFRFWLVRAVTRVAPVRYLDGTPWLNVYYRLMGSRIGRDVFLGSHDVATFDVVEVGDGSSVGIDTTLDGASVEGGYLTISAVRVGRGCYIGNRCSLGNNVVMEDGAGLADLSMLPDGARVSAGELWKGSPAFPAGRLEAETPRRLWSAGASLAQLAGILLLPMVILAAVFPGLMLVTHMGHMDEGYSFLIVSPLIALAFVMVLCAEMLAVKRLIAGRLRQARYPIGGSFYVRKWFFDQLMSLSFDLLENLYETLYVRPWLIALGARIGARSEIAAAGVMHPDLLEIGAECMVADQVLFGAPKIRSGWVSVSPVRIGDRVFIGNGAVLPGGAKLGDKVLIGALSVPPETNGGQVPDGSSWFGSPPMRLPARYHSQTFSEAQTYRPPARLVAQRLGIEFFRVVLPATLFVVLASLMMNATDILQDYIGLGQWLLILPLLYAAAGALALAATVMLKIILIGRYEPGEKPFWCAYVWRSDLVTGMYDNLCGFFFLDILRGTPFLPWVLRAFGVKVGRRCYIDSAWLTEFDLVEIGDEAAINDHANLQTHLFEDRVIKMGRVRIGRRCSVGAMATVLYDTEMKEGSTLGELSLVMKGETLPPGTHWHGIPSVMVEPSAPREGSVEMAVAFRR